MHLTRWPFWWPWRCASTVLSAFTYASCSDFNLSHWTPQWVEYFLRIAPATTRVPYKQAKNTIKTNASHSLAISTAKAMRRYSTKDINQFAVLRTSIEATDHCNRSRIHSILPWRLPGSHSNKQKNTIKQQNKHQDLHSTSQTKKTNVLSFVIPKDKLCPQNRRPYQLRPGS